MKVLLFYLLLLVSRFKFQEHYCGYYGSAATQIERDLDECMKENVKENRVLMSIGFENCTGFNFSTLEDKIAEPLKNKEEEINKALINLSFDVCKFNSDANEDQDLTDDQVLRRKKYIDECKKYFDNVIQNVFDSENLSSILEEDDEPLVDMVDDQETVDEIKGKIQALVQPISKCKGPQKELETRLKEKYLEDYLQKMTNPSLPSFSWDNVDVLLHPDIYIMKNDGIEVPDFDNENVNQPNNNMILIPREKTITMDSRGQELDQKVEEQKDKIQSKQYWDRLKFWRSQGSIQQDNQELQDLQDDFMLDSDAWNENHTHKTHQLVEKDDDKTDKLYKQKVQIQNFWDKDINIKNKRINDEDFDRYKIKGWNIDNKIDKLFDIKKLI